MHYEITNATVFSNALVLEYPYKVTRIFEDVKAK